MTYQEKEVTVSIVSSVLISLIYIVYVLGRRGAVEMAVYEELRFWGRALVVYIPVQIVPRIVVMIVFMIINKIVADEEDPGFADEMDKLIEMKATRNFYHLFLAGFFLAMGMLAFGVAVTPVFATLLIAMTLAGLFLESSQLYYYRRGV